MAIKQQGGVFGRNPTFNDVDVDGTLTVNGSILSDADINIPDDKKLYIGDNEDLTLYHDSANDRSYIVETGASNLYIQCANFRLASAEGNEFFILADDDGGVELRYNNETRLETTDAGASLTGSLTVNGFDIDPSDDQGAEHIHGTSSTFYQNGTVDLFTMTVPYSTSGNGYWGVIDLAVAARTAQSSDDVSLRVANFRIMVSRTGNNSGSGNTGVDVQVDESTNAYSEVGGGGSSSAITVSASIPAASTSDTDVAIQLTIASDAGTASQARFSGMFMGHRAITFS
jgi:hypothetical protein